MDIKSALLAVASLADKISAAQIPCRYLLQNQLYLCKKARALVPFLLQCIWVTFCLSNSQHRHKQDWVAVVFPQFHACG